MCILVHIRHFGIRKYLHLVFKILNQLLHREVVRIRSEMLDSSLQHLQVMLKTECLQFIVRLIVIFLRAVLNKNVICLQNVVHDLFPLHDIRQPAAVLGCDIVFPVGKRACPGQSVHNRA